MVAPDTCLKLGRQGAHGQWAFKLVPMVVRIGRLSAMWNGVVESPFVYFFQPRFGPPASAHLQNLVTVGVCTKGLSCSIEATQRDEDGGGRRG